MGDERESDEQTITRKMTNLGDKVAHLEGKINDLGVQLREDIREMFKSFLEKPSISFD